MNILNFNLIVDKTIQRHIRILFILSNSSQPISLDNLAKQCGVSSRTISNDIKILQDSLPSEIELTNIPKIGIQLNCPETAHITSFVNELSMDSPLFQVIECLFNDIEENTVQYGERLYLSEVTVRNYLKILQKIVREFNLDLELSPVKLIGNEIDIRCFFFSFFKNNNAMELLPSYKKHIKVYYDSVKEAQHSFSSVLQMDYRRAVHWLLIIEQRVKLGHFVSIDPSSIEVQCAKRGYTNFSNVYLKNMNLHLGITELPIDELVFAFILRLDTIVYIDYSNSNYALLNGDYISIATWEHLMTSFFNEFGLERESNEPLVTLLQAFLSNNYLLSTLSPLFQKNSHELNKQTQVHHWYAYSKWVAILSSFNAEKQLGITSIKDVAVSLTNLTASYLLESNLASKRVLFALSGESTSLNYLKILVASALPQKTPSVFSYNEPVTDQMIKDLNIQVCVHNFTLEEKLKNCTSLRISPLPTVEDLNVLRDLLTDIPTQELDNFFPEL